MVVVVTFKYVILGIKKQQLERVIMARILKKILDKCQRI